MQKRLLDNETLRGLVAWSALVGGVWIGWQILSPFLVPLAWAGVIAFATDGPYRRLSARLRSPGVAAQQRGGGLPAARPPSGRLARGPIRGPLC